MQGLLEQLKAHWQIILLILLGVATSLYRRELRKRPVKEEKESQLPTLEESADRCSEAAIRALARNLHHLPREEAWSRLREHYHSYVCADLLDLSRFEEIVVETWDRHGDEDEAQD
jgi:hypothetical protein